jgi:YHS domain-containing protein
MHRGRAYVRIQHAGYIYYLCCPRCQAEFEAHSAVYARPEYGEKMSKATESTASAKPQRRSLPYR